MKMIKGLTKQEYMRKYYLENKDRLKERQPGYYAARKQKLNASPEAQDELRKQKREYRKRPEVKEKIRQRRHNANYMLSYVRSRAKKAGIPCNLTPGDLILPAVCPVLGIPIRVSRSHVDDNSPTVDRLIPNKGYVKGNVWIISFRANRLKFNATSEELFKVARAVQLIEGYAAKT